MKKWTIGTVAVAALAVTVFGLPQFSGGPSASFAEGNAGFNTEVKRHPNGVYEVSALTKMTGVKAEMVRWWFADYMQTTAHYKRWHPTAHIWMDWENKAPGEYIGASHLVHEYIGEDLAKLRIQFVPPEDILGNVDLREDDVAVCAKAGLLEQPLYGGKMCRIIRNTDEGAEMRSRFWLGIVGKRNGNKQIASIEGLLGNTYLARMVAVRKSGAVDLMNHATEEMGYLSRFLPDLYANEIVKSAEAMPSEGTD